MASINLTTFRTMPLLRSYISVDTKSRDLLRHEVRRDTASGLTLKATFPVVHINKPN